MGELYEDRETGGCRGVETLYKGGRVCESTGMIRGGSRFCQREISFPAADADIRKAVAWFFVHATAF